MGDRRAAIAGGPDVWEVVARIREISGTLNARVDQVHAESGLAPALVQLAVEFAAAHPGEVPQLIARNEAAITRSQDLTAARDALSRDARSNTFALRMTVFLLDEMLPPPAATSLRDEHDLEAHHVGELAMAHTEDGAIAAFAREHSRVLVTENFRSPGSTGSAECPP